MARTGQGTVRFELLEQEEDWKYNPIQKLAAAVLYRAMLDMQDKSERVKDDARRWFSLPDEQTFSFLWCAEVMNMSPKAIIDALEKYDKLKYRLYWDL